MTTSPLSGGISDSFTGTYTRRHLQEHPFSVEASPMASLEHPHLKNLHLPIHIYVSSHWFIGEIQCSTTHSTLLPVYCWYEFWKILIEEELDDTNQHRTSGFELSLK